MDNRVFTVLQEAAEELNLPNDIDRLKTLQKIYDEGLYFAAFIGHFSSGKSSLINNIIGRKILPQGTVETTPILTYIRYGQDEKAVLFFNDGSQKNISLGDVSGVMQKNGNIDVSNLEHMEIFINLDLLAHGLILLDTPGLNTIIKRHEKLLADSLARSSKIVYVTGGALSKVDAERLADITNQGFNMSFVRTHCDEIRESEEHLDDVIRSDCNLLKEYGLSENQCLHISNVEGSRCYENISALKEELTAIGDQAKESLEADTKAKLSVFSDRYLEYLQKIEEILSDKQSNNEVELNQKKEKLSYKIQTLTKSIEDYRKKLRSEIHDAQNELRGDMNLYIDRSLNKAERDIKKSSISLGDTDAMKAFIKNLRDTMLQELLAKCNDRMNPVIAEINGTLSAKSLQMESAELPDAENYADIVGEEHAELEEIINKLRVVNENKEKLEHMETQFSPEEIKELKRELVELQSDMEEGKQQYTALGTYTPKLIEVEHDTSGSDIGRKLGNLLDWATIVLPQGAISKVAKGAKVFPKIAKAVGMVEKGLHLAPKAKTGIMGFFGGISKAAATERRARKLIDTIQKGADLVGKVKGYAPAQFSDYLTFEHWGEKLGSIFDKPPVMKIDEEYEREWKENQRQIENQIKEKQAEAYRKKCALGLYESEQERRAAELKSLTVDEAELKKELERRDKQIKKETQEKLLAKWKADCAAWYRNGIESQLRQLVEEYLTDIPAHMESYQDRRSKMLMDKLVSEKSEYDRLIHMPPDETKEKLDTITALLKSVSEVRALLQ